MCFTVALLDLADIPELKVDSKCEPAGKIRTEVSPIGQ